MEYDSLMLAAPAIKATYAKLEDETAQAAFIMLVEFTDYSFEKYYDVRGKSHRDLVEKAIRKSEENRQKKSSSTGCFSCCYLTTACVQARGLPEDCAELESLRAFRDGYMTRRMDGPALILRYYRKAPQILAAMRARADMNAEFAAIFIEVTRCRALIAAGLYPETLERYRRMVETLEDRFLGTADPIPE